MFHVIGMLITVASIAGLGVIIDGATGVRDSLRAYVHARRAKPSRERGEPTTEDKDVEDTGS